MNLCRKESKVLEAGNFLKAIMQNLDEIIRLARVSAEMKQFSGLKLLIKTAKHPAPHFFPPLQSVLCINKK